MLQLCILLPLHILKTARKKTILTPLAVLRCYPTFCFIRQVAVTCAHYLLHVAYIQSSQVCTLGVHEIDVRHFWNLRTFLQRLLDRLTCFAAFLRLSTSTCQSPHAIPESASRIMCYWLCNVLEAEVALVRAASATRGILVVRKRLAMLIERHGGYIWRYTLCLVWC